MAGNCAYDRQMLDRYFDGELTRDDAEQVDRHLQTCAVCRGHVDRNQLLADGLRYAVDRQPLPEKLAWIGSRCANPLGLFDTAGNAAEMLMDLFRFSIDSRLHGAAGGFLVKGGSYRKRISEIMPGRREEMPYFLKDGAFRSTDLGFRVVLSGIVNPHNRNDILRQQWREVARTERGSADAIALNPARDMVGEIERLIAHTNDEVNQKNLFLIKDFIKKSAHS